jgi:hypothetical protein
MLEACRLFVDNENLRGLSVLGGALSKLQYLWDYMDFFLIKTIKKYNI